MILNTFLSAEMRANSIWVACTATRVYKKEWQSYPTTTYLSSSLPGEAYSSNWSSDTYGKYAFDYVNGTLSHMDRIIIRLSDIPANGNPFYVTGYEQDYLHFGDHTDCREYHITYLSRDTKFIYWHYDKYEEYPQLYSITYGKPYKFSYASQSGDEWVRVSLVE